MMAGWQRHDGKVVALPYENIDTDQLIPARFMSTPRSEGYARFLLHDMARDTSGALRADFPLARVPDASILITQRNFGCGSSREAAVYALVDAGFRVVIASSFGDIFASNAVNNGLLPAKVTESEADALVKIANEHASQATIDLAQCEIVMNDLRIRFDLDPVWQTKLISGWDDIDLTRAEASSIAAYRAERKIRSPWVWM